MIELYLRLTGATLLLLAPGALLARSASGAVVTSLTLIFGAMLVVFATDSSLTLALWLLVAAGLAAIPVALRRTSNRLLLGDVRSARGGLGEGGAASNRLLLGG